MLLSKILNEITVLSSYDDSEITGVTANISEVSNGMLFICISGSKIDGHIFADEALKKGATYIVVEKDTEKKRQIMVSSSRTAFAKICANYYFNPSDSLKLIATTGTNGKTSITTIIKHILQSCNKPTGMFTTIEALYGKITKEVETTTPDAKFLHKTLGEMKDAGIKYVALEASSHSLIQERLYGCTFDVAIFTNLTPEHLDYHKSMEEYYKAKKKLFSMARYAIINIDDKYGRRLVKEIEIPFVTYSYKDKSADYYADNIECSSRYSKFTIISNGICTPVYFTISGVYYIQNVLAVFATCMYLGVASEKIALELSQMSTIKGRNELIYSGEFDVICDYAHTPDALQNLLCGILEYCKGRIILVFGCGGDRDKTKRGLMGAIAAKYADVLVVTSDNPRTEHPQSIIDDIVDGIPKAVEFIRMCDRKTAIEYAINIAQKDDIVVLTGKGHEQYQIIGEHKLPFDEHKIVNEVVSEIK